jgi:hypothetical protein
MLFLRRGTYWGLWAAALVALTGSSLVGCDDSSDGAAPLPSEPEDVAGNYTVNLKNGDNGCELESWEEGAETSDVKLELTQDDRDLTGEVTDVRTALVLTIALGSAEFEGTVTGSHFTLTNHGTVSGTDGDCAFTRTATIRGQIDGDAVEGTVTFTYETNGDSSCGERETCESVQQFNGTRPPTGE